MHILVPGLSRAGIPPPFCYNLNFPLKYVSLTAFAFSLAHASNPIFLIKHKLKIFVLCGNWDTLSYWSSTTFAEHTKNAWIVMFDGAYVLSYYKTNHYHVRCVRG